MRVPVYRMEKAAGIPHHGRVPYDIDDGEPMIDIVIGLMSNHSQPQKSER